MSEFKQQYSLYNRKQESERVLHKYPDRIPIICERNKRSQMPQIDKHKYLVPLDITFGQFIYVIRKRLRLEAEKAIFLFVKGIIPPCNATLHEYYHHYKDEDGFLYITYSSENVFGINIDIN